MVWSTSSAATLAIRNSTLSGNKAFGGTRTGTFSNEEPPGFGDGLGGAIYTFSDGPPSMDGITTVINNSTITLNQASSGNAVELLGGSMGVGGGINAVELQSGSVIVASTIIAGNIASNDDPDVAGDFVGDNHNLIGDPGDATGIGQAGDFTFASLKIQNIDQVLDTTLQNNGGPTFTQARIAGSPVIGRGSNPAGLPTDKCGDPRSQHGATDIGAGAEMRQSLGTAEFSGMIGVTLFGIFLTPVFFFVLTRLGGHKQAGAALVSQAAASPAEAPSASSVPAEAVGPLTGSLRRAEDGPVGNTRARPAETVATGRAET